MYRSIRPVQTYVIYTEKIIRHFIFKTVHHKFKQHRQKVEFNNWSQKLNRLVLQNQQRLDATCTVAYGNFFAR